MDTDVLMKDGEVQGTAKEIQVDTEAEDDQIDMDNAPISQEEVARTREAILPILLQMARDQHYPGVKELPQDAVDRAGALFTDDTCRIFLRHAHNLRREWPVGIPTSPPINPTLPSSTHVKSARDTVSSHDNPTHMKHDKNDCPSSDTPIQSHTSIPDTVLGPSLTRSPHPEPSQTLALQPHMNGGGAVQEDLIIRAASSSSDMQISDASSEREPSPPAAPIKDISVATLTATDSDISPRTGMPPVSTPPAGTSHTVIPDKPSNHQTSPSSAMEPNSKHDLSPSITTPESKALSQEPEASLPLSESFMIPGIWGTTRCSKYSSTHIFSFDLDQGTLAAIERWSQRYDSFDTNERHAVLRLVCIPYAPVKQIALRIQEQRDTTSPEETFTFITTLPVQWPDGAGTFIVQLNANPPGHSHQFKQGQAFDILGELREGENELRILQIGGMDDRALALYAAEPSQDDLLAFKNWQDEQSRRSVSSYSIFPGSFSMSSS